MVPNAVMATKIARKSPLLCRLPCFSRKPTSEFSTNTIIRANPFDRSGGHGSSYRSISLTPTTYGFKELGRAQLQFKKLRSDCFRIFAVSNGGSGGGNGGFGGSGGGNSGDSAGSSGGGRQNRSLLSWYLSLLEKYPVLTKAITSAILTFIGDMICQLAVDQVASLDWKRTFLFTFVGLVLVGPTLHFWYLYLSKLITTPGALGAFNRLLLDQFLFAPTFIGVVFSTLLTLEGRPQQAIPKLQQEWFSSVLANWQLWIPFQFLNFRFVPQQFQVLAANFVSLIWNVILSYKAHKVLEK